MRTLRSNRSGQVLIIAALAVALLISSTIAYTYQTSRVTNVSQPFSVQDFVRNVKIGTRNLMIGSLVNLAGGGTETLGTNLDRWVDFVRSQYYLGECVLDFELCGDGPYSDGLWQSWTGNGFGVSSVKGDFTLNLSDSQSEVIVAFPVNITSSISSNGAYYSNPAFWQNINMAINLFNEGEPALAEDIAVYYQHTSGWRNAEQLSDYSLTDYGNGTYHISFTVSRFWTHQLSIRVYDQRSIYVQSPLASTKIVEQTPVFLVASNGIDFAEFDNVSWTPLTGASGMGEILSMGSNAQSWLIGCKNRKIFEYNGYNLTEITPTENPFTRDISAIGWGNGYWLVGDINGGIQKYNGSSWTDLTAEAGFKSLKIPITEIMWNQDFGYWLIGSDSVVKKFDGSSWADVSPSLRQFENEISAISCDGSTWLVGDLSGVIQKFNGTTWTDLTAAAGFYSSGKSINAIDWGNSQFLVGGESGTVKIYDGSSWSDKSSGWGSGIDIFSIEYSDTYAYWLVGGGSGCIQSFNGSTWTDMTTQAGLSGSIYTISAEFQC